MPVPPGVISPVVITSARTQLPVADSKTNTARNAVNTVSRAMDSPSILQAKGLRYPRTEKVFTQYRVLSKTNKQIAYLLWIGGHIFIIIATQSLEIILVRPHLKAMGGYMTSIEA